MSDLVDKLAKLPVVERRLTVSSLSKAIHISERATEGGDVKYTATIMVQAQVLISREAMEHLPDGYAEAQQNEIRERVAAHVVKLALDHLNESNKGAPAIKVGEELEYQPCALVSEGVLLCHPRTFEKVMEYFRGDFEMKDGKEPFDHSTLR